MRIKNKKTKMQSDDNKGVVSPTDLTEDGRLAERVADEGWTYIRTVVDVVRQPILVLDQKLHVMAANESFYRTFQVNPEETEGSLIYKLGNGQWNIPALRKLLEDILPTSSFFKGFEVTHEFPFIGKKVMILNARRIYLKEGDTSKLFPPILLLAMEDVTEIMIIAETLASHANQLEEKFGEGTRRLEADIVVLQKEIKKLKRRA